MKMIKLTKLGIFYSIEQFQFYIQPASRNFYIYNQSIREIQLVKQNFAKLNQIKFSYQINQSDIAILFPTHGQKNILTVKTINQEALTNIIPKIIYNKFNELKVQIMKINLDNSIYKMKLPCQLPYQIKDNDYIKLKIQIFGGLQLKQQIRKYYIHDQILLDFKIISNKFKNQNSIYSQFPIISDIFQISLEDVQDQIIFETYGLNQRNFYLQITLISNQNKQESFNFNISALNTVITQQFIEDIQVHFKVGVIQNEMQNENKYTILQFPFLNMYLMKSQQVDFPQQFQIILKQGNDEQLIGNFYMIQPIFNINIMFQVEIKDETKPIQLLFLSDNYDQISKFGASVYAKNTSNKLKKQILYHEQKQLICFCNVTISNFKECNQEIFMNGGLTDISIDTKLLIQLQIKRDMTIDSNSFIYFSNIGRYYLEKCYIEKILVSKNYSNVSKLIQFYKKTQNTQLNQFKKEKRDQIAQIFENMIIEGQSLVEATELLFYYQIFQKQNSFKLLKSDYSKNFALIEYFKDYNNNFGLYNIVQADQLMLPNKQFNINNNFHLISFNITKLSIFANNIVKFKDKISLKCLIQDLFAPGQDIYSQIISEFSFTIKFLNTLILISNNFQNIQPENLFCESLTIYIQQDLQQTLSSFLKILQIGSYTQEQSEEIVHILSLLFQLLELFDYSFCEGISIIQEDIIQSPILQNSFKLYYEKFVRYSQNFEYYIEKQFEIYCFDNFQYVYSINFYILNCCKSILDSKSIATHSFNIIRKLKTDNLQKIDRNLLIYLSTLFSYLTITTQQFEFLQLLLDYICQNVDMPQDKLFFEISPFLLVNLLKFIINKKHSQKFINLIQILLNSKHKQFFLYYIIKIALQSDTEYLISINSILLKDFSFQDISNNQIYIILDFYLFQQDTKEKLIIFLNQRHKGLISELLYTNVNPINYEYLNRLYKNYIANNDIRANFILDCMIILDDKQNKQQLIQEKLNYLKIKIDPYYLIHILYRFYQNLVLNNDQLEIQRSNFIKLRSDKKIMNFLLLDDIQLIQSKLQCYELFKPREFLDLLYDSFPMEIKQFHAGKIVTQVQDCIQYFNIPYFRDNTPSDSSFWIKFSPSIALPRLIINDFDYKKNGAATLQKIYFESYFDEQSHFQPQTNFSNLIGLYVYFWPK